MSDKPPTKFLFELTRLINHSCLLLLPTTKPLQTVASSRRKKVHWLTATDEERIKKVNSTTTIK
jgi:hypothetical protein